MNEDTPNEDPYRFNVLGILGSESYQTIPVVPEWLNPRRFGAWARALRMEVPERNPDAWDPWLSNVTEQFPVVLALRDFTFEKTSAGYECGREFSIQVFADSHKEARDIAEQCFDAGPFEKYTIQSFEDEAATNQSVTEEFDRLTDVYNDQGSGSGYEPVYPEIHLGDEEVEDSGLAGAIRIDLTHAQLREIIDRAHEHLQETDPHSEQFDLHLKIWDKEMSDQITGAVERMVSETDFVFQTVSFADLANEDQDTNESNSEGSQTANAAVSLVFLMSEAEAQQLLRYIDTIPEPVYKRTGMPVWHHRLTDYSADRFVDHAESALDMDEPGVVRRD